MSASPRKPTAVHRTGPGVGEAGESSRPMPDFVERQLRAARERLANKAKEQPVWPRWPMFTGVFTFPWRLSVLGAWMLTSFGLMITAWLVMMWWGPGMILGAASARFFGLPACIAAAISFGYAATCTMTIVEKTSYGEDRFEVSPSLVEWRDWVWNYGRFVVLLLQASMVGALLQCLARSASPLPFVAGTFAAFPFVLLGALASGEAWVPLAIGAVLRSVVPLWWAWGLFYVETAPLAWAWTLVVRAGLRESPWPMPLYGAPLLAAAILIYARLVGRLAGCIVLESKKQARKGDDDAS
jgi:hypothetical protein